MMIDNKQVGCGLTRQRWHFTWYLSFMRFALHTRVPSLTFHNIFWDDFYWSKELVGYKIIQRYEQRKQKSLQQILNRFLYKNANASVNSKLSKMKEKINLKKSNQKSSQKDNNYLLLYQVWWQIHRTSYKIINYTSRRNSNRKSALSQYSYWQKNADLTSEIQYKITISSELLFQFQFKYIAFSNQDK